MSINEIFLSQNWILSMIFLILILMSVSSWYIIFHKILFFRTQKKSLDRNCEIKSDLSDSIEKSNSVLKEKITPEILDRKLNLIFEEFRDKANFGQTYLASTANLTPFIGLFGTVLGVYFALIDISKLGNASISTVAGPIGEALIATAIGLWCAIPAAFAYNYFSKESSNLVKKMKNIVEKKLINAQ